jgi:hypothetical protein
VFNYHVADWAVVAVLDARAALGVQQVEGNVLVFDRRL